MIMYPKEFIEWMFMEGYTPLQDHCYHKTFTIDQLFKYWKTMFRNPMEEDHNLQMNIEKWEYENIGKVEIGDLIYITIKIGNQIWMAENLANPIGSCIFRPNDPLGKKYGGYYQWDDLIEIQKILPEGWRVPDNNDWEQLIEFLGGKEVAGGKMKSCNGEFWRFPNTGATDESGFNALGAGSGNSDGSFSYLKFNAYFWSSTQDSSTNAYYYNLYYFSVNAYRNDYGKSNRYSVRCLRDC